MAKKSKAKMSLLEKIIKSLLALAGFFGLISPSGVRLGWITIVILVAAVIILAIYWHLLELFFDVIDFFKNLGKDIKYIKKKIK